MKFSLVHLAVWQPSRRFPTVTKNSNFVLHWKGTRMQCHQGNDPPQAKCLRLTHVYNLSDSFNNHDRMPVSKVTREREKVRFVYNMKGWWDPIEGLMKEFPCVTFIFFYSLSRCGVLIFFCWFSHRWTVEKVKGKPFCYVWTIFYLFICVFFV